MDKFFGNLGAVLITGLVLAILIAVFPDSGYATSVGAGDLWLGVFQWMHVFFGITWIGLLYYFNFVQIPTMSGGGVLPFYFIAALVTPTKPQVFERVDREEQQFWQLECHGGQSPSGVTHA